MVLAFIWIMLLFILQCCSTNYVDNVHLFCLFYSGVGLTMVIAFIWIMLLFILQRGRANYVHSVHLLLFLQWCSTNHGASVHLDHVVVYFTVL